MPCYHISECYDHMHMQQVICIGCYAQVAFCRLLLHFNLKVLFDSAFRYWRMAVVVAFVVVFDGKHGGFSLLGFR